MGRTAMVWAGVWLAAAMAGCAGVPRTGGSAGLDGVRGGVVIAHRGASAYLPEHTLEAYALAYALGADLIEPDVVMSSDGVLICAHDVVMDGVTDAAARFPDRARADGKRYWIDFTLAEIKTLSKTGRARDGVADDARGFSVATLDEMLSMIDRLNERVGARTGREVGVIPEPKAPTFHAAEGRDIMGSLVAELARHGYERRGDRAIVQCFDLDALEQLRDAGCALRLVWLIHESPREEDLERAAAFCDGLGPNRKLLENGDGEGTALLAWAEERGLGLYPYTFRGDGAAVRRFFVDHGVTGLFADDPDVALRAIGR